MRRIALALGSLLIAACADGTDKPQGPFRAVATFRPSMSMIPVPNNLLLSGSEDLTLNIPVVNPADFSDPQVALGRLDGWSTSAPFTIPFSKALDPATLQEGVTVRIFEVTLDTSVVPVGGAVNGIVRELTDAEYDLGIAPEVPDGGTIRVFLNKPLAPRTSYMVVLTNGITDMDGRKVVRDGEYDLVRQTKLLPPDHPFFSLQLLTLAMEGFAEGAGVVRDDIVLTFTFTTQSIGATLGSLALVAQGGEAGVISAICGTGLLDCTNTNPAISLASVVMNGFLGTTGSFVPGSPGLADVYQGGLTLPYFLTAASNSTNSTPVTDTTPLNEFWHARYGFIQPSGPDTEMNLTFANTLPAQTSTEEVPILVCTPNNGTMKPWPVVIYQHGITRDRSDVLLVADTLCGAGFAVVAIDMPLHGLTDPANPLFTSYMDAGLRERTFGLDLIDNTTLAPIPDGVADPSGQHFINLSNLLVTRDNLRQAISDLFFLKTILASIDVDGGGPDLDATAVSFVGHSLGAIVGIPYAQRSTLDSVVLSVPGGGLPKLLVNSVTFGPIINGGLASAGVLAGTPDYESFLFAAQTVVDTADAINHAGSLMATGMPIYMNEIVGGGPGGGLPDQVIPNSVATAPLSGTEPLATAMSLTSISSSTTGSPIQGIVRFVDGVHGSLIDPVSDPAANAEMQSQVASFLLSLGTSLTITNGGVVQ